MRFRVASELLDATAEALAEIGEEAVEGVVVWVGRQPVGDVVEVARAVVPGQVAFRSEDGLAVMIPDSAVSELILSLDDSEFIPIRVHSHPGEAYHSGTDDLNRLLGHKGAISIVVPYFARRGMDLSTCSVNELDDDFRWRELSVEEVRRRFDIV